MLIKLKRDFFDRDGKYYKAGTVEYNGPLEDEHGNKLIPSDAIVVSEEGTLPFQPDSPIPKPGFGAKPLEEQVLDMIPGAGATHIITPADPGSAPVELTDEQKKEKAEAAAETLAETAKVDEKAREDAEAEAKKSTAAGLAEANKAAEVVMETIDPFAKTEAKGKK